MLFRDYLANPTYRSSYKPQYRNLHSGSKYRSSYYDRVENAPYTGAYTKKIHRPFNPHWLFSYTPSYYNM
uniref:Uncharacterized protein n=1 Tax=Acrobeloides nanus TaxID=290746 RepID=A0A914DH54_9BILA